MISKISKSTRNAATYHLSLSIVAAALLGAATFAQGPPPPPPSDFKSLPVAPSSRPSASAPNAATPRRSSERTEAPSVEPAPAAVPVAPSTGVPTLTPAAAPLPAAEPAPAAALSKLKPHEQYLRQRYPQLAGEITPQNLNAHIRALTRRESRVVGYPGEREAAEYVHLQFQDLFGSENVREEKFNVTVPMDPGGELRLP
ncbi:MAG TPA: hypothetical protein VK689_10470, partial [Armatimonadota bacterium]|nr:hypothetical protein [Armatimonadota bacterium]